MAKFTSPYSRSSTWRSPAYMFPEAASSQDSFHSAYEVMPTPEDLFIDSLFLSAEEHAYYTSLTTFLEKTQSVETLPYPLSGKSPEFLSPKICTDKFTNETMPYQEYLANLLGLLSRPDETISLVSTRDRHNIVIAVQGKNIRALRSRRPRSINNAASIDSSTFGGEGIFRYYVEQTRGGARMSLETYSQKPWNYSSAIIAAPPRHSATKATQTCKIGSQ